MEKEVLVMSIELLFVRLAPVEKPNAGIYALMLILKTETWAGLI
jgi:hypothetical protein